MKLFTTALLLLCTLGAIKAQINYRVTINGWRFIEKGEAWPDLDDTLHITYYCSFTSDSAGVADSLWADFCHHLSKYDCVKELDIYIKRSIDLSLLDQSKLTNLEGLYIHNPSYTPFQPIPGINSNLNLSGFSHLKTLVLSVPILPRLPESISKLSHLKLLSVGYKLPELPQSLGNLQQLEALAVSFDSLYTLPDVVYQLKNLSQLVVEESGISYLSPKIAKLHKLEQLYLFNTHLPTIPRVITRLKNLRNLDLRGDKSLTQISISTLKKCKKLKSLNINGSPAAKNEEKMKALLQTFKKMEIYYGQHFRCYG